MTLSQKAVLALLVPFIQNTNTDPLRMAEPRIGDGHLCHIFQGFGRQTCFEEEKDKGGGGGGGGDDDKTTKTFTQEDFDKQIGKVRTEERAKFKDFDAFKAKAGEVDTLKTQLEELNAKLEDAGKTADQKATNAAERAARQRDQEKKEAGEKLTAAELRATNAEKKLRDRDVSAGLGAALDEGKVLGKARSKAINALRDESDIEMDEDGKITSLTYEGIAFKTAAEAAIAFLKNNPFFASNGGASGGGTKQPGSGGAGAGATGGRQLHEMSEDELLNLDAQTRRAGNGR